MKPVERIGEKVLPTNLEAPKVSKCMEQDQSGSRYWRQNEALPRLAFNTEAGELMR